MTEADEKIEDAVQDFTIRKMLEKPGGHEKAIAKHFPDKVKYEGPAVFDQPLYVLAFTNRCGSNLFADYLRQTGKFGGFHESLNHESVISNSSKSGIESFPDYIRYLHGKFAKGGVLGVKASWAQMILLSRTNCLAMFPAVKVIHIRRADVFSQAVSHWIAHQTKKWTSQQTGLDVDPVYEFDSISQIVLDIHRQNAMIPVVAQLIGAPLAGVLYEAVTRDPQKAVVALGQRFGVDLSDWKAKDPKIEKQADEINDRFLHRFKADLRALIQ